MGAFRGVGFGGDTLQQFAMWRSVGAAFGFLLFSPLRLLGAFWMALLLTALISVAIPPVARAMLPMSPEKLAALAAPTALVEGLAFVAAGVAVHRALLVGA